MMENPAEFILHASAALVENKAIISPAFIEIKNGKIISISNSDPKNGNSDDNFFDDLYRGYHIERLTAMRLINCNAEKRGEITEILVTNY